MSKQTSVEWLENQLKERYSLMNSEPLFEQAKAMEKEKTEENMAKAITFGWELSHHHRLNTEEKLLQMQKDFIISVIEGGDMSKQEEPKQYTNEELEGFEDFKSFIRQKQEGGDK